MQKHLYIAVLLMAFGCSLFIAAKTAHASTADSIDTSLSQLEDRFFEHQYDSDTDVDRLNRLEQFVYGSQQPGPISERIKHIKSTIPDEEPASTPPSTNDNNIDGVATPDASPAANNKPATSPITPISKTFDYGSYPRVVNLEQELLGHTYPNESLQDRLVRLETKAYGAPSSSTDLCQRVDLLDDYAQRHDLYGEHQSVNNPPATAMTFNSTTPISTNATSDPAPNSTIGSRARYQNPWTIPAQRQTQAEYTSSSGTFVGSAEERVSMMEAQIFHHTSPDKPLDERLEKLKKKILPNENIANLSPTQQTVKLWDALHPNEKNQVASLIADADVPTTTADETTNSANNNNVQPPANSPKRSWLHRLATAAGSVAGTSMSPNTGTQTTYGTNAGYIPGMFPSNSRFIGASVGPGSGPAGLPVGFW